jgi:hypothetical protein
MSTLSIEKSRNLESTAPKKGSANCTRHRGARSRPPWRPPRNRYGLLNRRPSESPPSRSRVKAEEPRVECVVKQERTLSLLSQPEGASIEEMMLATGWQQPSVRGFPGGHGEKETRLIADVIQAQRRRSPLSHRNAAGADAEKPAIDVVKALPQLSEMTIFELRGVWRRLHCLPLPMRLSRDLFIGGITYKFQERPPYVSPARACRDA